MSPVFAFKRFLWNILLLSFQIFFFFFPVDISLQIFSPQARFSLVLSRLIYHRTYWNPLGFLTQGAAAGDRFPSSWRFVTRVRGAPPDGTDVWGAVGSASAAVDGSLTLESSEPVYSTCSGPLRLR